jgi:N-carbamoylputrescine amidase
MQGHAAANMVPVIASNRIGREVGESCELSFYGSSFIAGPTGEIVAEAGRDGRAVIAASFDRDALARDRAAWGLFRDRRPDLYGPLRRLDGTTGDP